MEKARLLAYALIPLLLADLALSVYLAYRGPFPAAPPVGSPTAFRNIFLHIPLAWTSLTLFIITFVSAILYLATGKERYDRLVRASAAIGLVYAAGTLITGSAWAAESWEGVHIGFSWTWDPRETSVLLLFLAYLVYFIIRASIPDPDRAATLSNVYAVAAFAMVPVVFIAPSIAHASLHPSFEQAGAFMRRPSVAPLFAAKVVTVMATGILLTVLAATRGWESRIVRYAVAAIALAYIAAAVVLASPYLTAKLAYVDNAVVKNGEILALQVETLNGRVYNVTLPHPVESPVKPPVIHVEGGGVRPTIINHIVELGPLKQGKIIIVTHWSVALSLALTGVCALAGLLVAERVSKS